MHFVWQALTMWKDEEFVTGRIYGRPVGPRYDLFNDVATWTFLFHVCLLLLTCQP